MESREFYDEEFNTLVRKWMRGRKKKATREAERLRQRLSTRIGSTRRAFADSTSERVSDGVPRNSGASTLSKNDPGLLAKSGLGSP